MSDDDKPPIMPARLAVRLDEQGDSLSLDLREKHRGVSIFLCLWLSGWTVGCVFLLKEILTKNDPMTVVFAIPFWVSWIGVACLLAGTFFGRQRLIFDPEGLVEEWEVLIPLSRRLIPLPELRKFREGTFSVDDETRRTTIGIEAVTLGRSLTFGTGLATEERAWVLDRLDTHRELLQKRAGIEIDDEVDRKDCRRCEMPSDCRWNLADDSFDLGFQQYGKFRPGIFFGLLLINGFWNGIVGVFVGGLLGLGEALRFPRGKEWWGLFFFLIPFEAVGLVMIAGLFRELLEPVRLTIWRFGPGTIGHVTTRLGLPLGRRRRYPYDRIHEAVIRDDLEVPKKDPTYPTGEQFRLVLSESDGREICAINGLTLGEARWMKGRMQEQGLLK